MVRGEEEAELEGEYGRTGGKQERRGKKRKKRAMERKNNVRL